jgi:ATP:ADP antiporter, AAA family
VSGAFVADRLARTGPPSLLMLVAAAILTSTLGVTYLVHRQEMGRDRAERETRHEEPVARGNAFALVFRDRYLLLLAALIFILNIVTKTGDYVLDRMLIARAAAAAAKAPGLGITASVYVAQFKAGYFEWINIFEIILQSLVVSRVIKYAGLRGALVLAPLVSMVGYGSVFVAPVIGILLATRVAESTLDYSLSNTVRQALWLVTSREDKYKAKQVVDGFVWRAGDSFSAAVVWIGSHTASSARGFIAVNVVLTVAWAMIAVVAGREYTRRRKRGSATVAEPA